MFAVSMPAGMRTRVAKSTSSYSRASAGGSSFGTSRRASSVSMSFSTRTSSEPAATPGTSATSSSSSAFSKTSTGGATLRRWYVLPWAIPLFWEVVVTWFMAGSPGGGIRSQGLHGDLAGQRLLGLRQRDRQNAVGQRRRHRVGVDARGQRELAGERHGG